MHISCISIIFWRFSEESWQLFCTHVIQALPDDKDHLLNCQSIDAPSPPAALLAVQGWGMQ